METNEKKEVKGTVWLWTVIGLIAGGCLGSCFMGFVDGIFEFGCADGVAYLSAFAGAGIVGFLAYRSSYKNGGNAPAWLWKSKKK